MEPDELVTNKTSPDIGTKLPSECSHLHTEQYRDNSTGNIDTMDDTIKGASVDAGKTANTTVSKDYVSGLGFTSEDVADGFLKWITGCAGARSKLLEEDRETYGFSDAETRQKGMMSRLKRQVSERLSSRRSKHPGKRYERSKSHEDKTRIANSTRPTSYKEAVREPVNNTLNPLNTSITASNESQRVPSTNTNSHVINDLGSPSKTLNDQYYGPYPCQTNIQSHPNTKYRKKGHPIVNPDVYNFTFPSRGYLVNIVNDHFTHQTKRDGAHWDLLKMREIGRKFEFRLFNYEKDRNLTRNQTLSLLTEIQFADHSNCDCFMFMISTHGLEQRNPAVGGKPDHALVCADDQLIFTSSILKMFNDRNCPSLKGKPKIFFIQACRGEELDHGSDVFVVHPRSVDRTDRTAKSDQISRRIHRKKSVDDFDTRPGQDSWAQQYGNSDVQHTPTTSGNTYKHQETSASVTMATGTQPSRGQEEPHFYAPKYSNFPTAASIRNSYTVTKVPFYPGTSSQRPLPFPIVDTPSLRCSNDMLVMYAIPQGMFAWRSQTDGSWMIDYLHQILMSHSMNSPKHFLSLLTKVSNVMSRRATNTPSMPGMHNKKAIPVIEHKLDKDIIFQPKVKGSEWVKTFQQMSL